MTNGGISVPSVFRNERLSFLLYLCYNNNICRLNFNVGTFLSRRVEFHTFYKFILINAHY